MRLTALWGPCLIVAALAPAAAGDPIMLAAGGKLEGKVDALASTPTQAAIVTPSGAQVTVDRSQIRQVIAPPSPLEEYARIKSEYADTADGQYRLAEWCQGQKLSKLRQAHLARVIQLDPNHAQAHAALGHVRVGGKWLTRDEAMAEKGLVRHGHRWVSTQEKVLLDEKATQAGTQKSWYQQVRLWKTWLAGSHARRRAEALVKLRAIEDPLAVEPLVKGLGKENEATRELLAQVLGKIPGTGATEALVTMVLTDRATAVRGAALDALVEREDPAAVDSFIAAIRQPAAIICPSGRWRPGLRRLAVVARRSAEALGELGDEKVIPHLIAGLVVEGEEIVNRTPPPREPVVVAPYAVGFRIDPPSARSVRVTSETFVAPGVVAVGYTAEPFNPALAAQMDRVRSDRVWAEMDNNEALFALRKLTGENFGFRKDLWTQWYRTRPPKPAQEAKPGAEATSDEGAKPDEETKPREEPPQD